MAACEPATAAPAPATLVDIGFNACHKQFGKRLPAILERAAAVGVRSVLITATDEASIRSAAKLADENEGQLGGVSLAYTAGVHPHHAKDFDATGAESIIREHVGKKYCMAVGECGLDFNRNFSPPDVQVDVFTRQVKLAKEVGLPLFLHERDAHEAFLGVMDAHWTPETPAVVHCFTGTAEQAAAYIARGMYIGLTGTVSMPRRGAALRALLSSSPPAIPLDRLLLETDAPFMHPFTEGSIAVPTSTDAAARVAEAGGGGGGRKGSRRRRTCEPAHMQHILATVAGCLGKTAEEVAAATSANAAAVFGLHVPAAPSATAPGGAAVSGDGTGKQAAPTTPPAAAAGGGGGSVPPAVQPVEEVLAEATAGRFVDTHIHLDEVLTALKVAIPGMAQGGSGSSEEEMLAAAIAASLAESGGSEAAAGGGGGAQAAAAEGGAEALDGLHPVLSSLFGAECDGVVAQFCDPASVATSLAVYPALLALRGVVGAFGCHPHHAKYYTESWEGRIREALAHPRAVALGECGLDYAKKQSPKQRQREVLVQQIALAVELGKPIVIHCRNAEADLLDIFKAHLPREWLVHVHCYTGNATHAAALLEGFPNVHFGFTGFITQDNPDAAATRQAIRHAIPPNRILFETDGPWMSPRVRGAHADVVLPVLQRLYDTGRYQSKPAPKVTAAGGGGGKGRRGKGQGAVGCGPRGQTCHAGAIPAIVAVVAREAGVPVRQLMETVRENSRRVYSV